MCRPNATTARSVTTAVDAVDAVDAVVVVAAIAVRDPVAVDQVVVAGRLVGRRVVVRRGVVGASDGTPLRLVDWRTVAHYDDGGTHARYSHQRDRALNNRFAP
jgi:hypothetical protein